MKGFVITHPGAGEASARELQQYGLIPKVLEHFLLFPATEEQLLELVYQSQTILYAGIHLTHCKRTTDIEQDITKAINAINFSPYFKKAQSFRVRMHTETEEVTMDLAAHAGDLIDKQCKEFELNVDLDEPDTSILIYASQTALLIGIDYAGADLGKRPYKIYNYAGTLKGSLASCVLQYAEITPEDNLLDPFCGCGIIPIEAAAFFSKTSVHKYTKKLDIIRQIPRAEEVFKKLDTQQKTPSGKIVSTDSQLKYVEASKKNAKIAGVEKHISFSRMDIEWLDTKFEEKSISKIVTLLPSPSKQHGESQVEKVLKEFFYQAAYILKPEGTITSISYHTDIIKAIAEEKGFHVVKETVFYSGQLGYHIIQLKKK